MTPAIAARFRKTPRQGACCGNAHEGVIAFSSALIVTPCADRGNVLVVLFCARVARGLLMHRSQ